MDDGLNRWTEMEIRDPVGQLTQGAERESFSFFFPGLTEVERGGGGKSSTSCLLTVGCEVLLR